MVYRAWQAYQVGGQDKDKVERAIEDGKLMQMYCKKVEEL